jgi:DNA-binding response OmpR family regulator
MPETILIADDEPNILLSLDYLMRREGFTVLQARDGDEALALLQQHRPRLVLLDVMMPGRSGHEVLAALRADESLKHTLVLMLSAKGRDTDVAKGLGLGADAYVTKPFSTQALVAQVRTLLAAPPAQA